MSKDSRDYDKSLLHYLRAIIMRIGSSAATVSRLMLGISSGMSLGYKQEGFLWEPNKA